MPRTEPIPQVSDAGIGGSAPHVARYPVVILDVMRRHRGVKDLGTEEIGRLIGAVYDGHCRPEDVEAVQQEMKYLEELDLVLWTGKAWTLKKVKV